MKQKPGKRMIPKKNSSPLATRRRGMTDAQLMRALKEANPAKYSDVDPTLPATPQPASPSAQHEPTKLEEAILAEIARTMGEQTDGGFHRRFLRRATGVENLEVAGRLVTDLGNCPKVVKYSNDYEEIFASAAHLFEMRPTNVVEAMLCIQLTATYQAGLKLLRNALLDGQTFEGKEMNLQRATTLMRLSLQQMEQLAKMQGNTPVQQKVVVEHVNIGPGGQAVVGVGREAGAKQTVQRGGRGAKLKADVGPQASRRGGLKNGNRSGDFSKAPACGARTRRGAPCRARAMANGRCRMHGGLSTGPRTAAGIERIRRARTIHGRRSTQARAERAVLRELIRRSRELLASLKGKSSCQ